MRIKSQKGITLASLAIYIAVVLIVVGILATITANFQSNVREINREGTNNSEIDKFNMYFIQEVKKQGNAIKSISATTVEFTSGYTYTFNSTDKAIYMSNSLDDRNIKIAENIDTCSFSNDLVNGKEVITVTIKAINSDTQTKEYVVSSEQIAMNYDDENSYINNKIVLPSGYKQIEYIQSSGSQYINTAISPTANTRIQTRVTLTGGVGSLYPIFGSRSSSYSNNFIAWCRTNYTFYTSTGGNTYTDTNTNVDLRNSIHLIDVRVREISIDDNVYTNSANLDYTSTARPIYIFALNDNGGVNRYSSAKMYSFRINDNGTLVGNFIPCLDNSNTPCMYDTVSKTTFYNQGSGSFTAGPEV